MHDRFLAGLTVLTLLAALVTSGCASSTTSPEASQPRHTQTSKDDYVLVILKRGPAVGILSDAERQTIQAEHLANIGRLAEAGRIVVAGPFGRENHDPTQRGIFIFDVPTLEEAEALTRTDPAVIAGVLTMELSRISTSADLRGALAAELAEQQAARDAGRERPMEETIRAYVLVRSDDGAKTERIIAETVPADRVVVTARVDDGRGFFIIDSTSVAEVRGWLEEQREAIGPITIDEWYASALLVRARG